MSDSDGSVEENTVVVKHDTGFQVENQTPSSQLVRPTAEYYTWGVGGALVESTPFVRRVMGSTPALAAT